MNIELGNIDNIINDDPALKTLVMSIIKEIADDVVFVLPVGTSEMVKESFDNFASKINFDFSLIDRPTRILPSIIKSIPVVVPQPVIPVVVPQPVIPVIIQEPVFKQVFPTDTVSAVDLTKRKK
jgi:hypothetical protein